MSTKLTSYVWDGCASSGMKLSSVAIMARLADFSSDEGVCWPSIATIARQIGAGESTVRTAISALEKEGWLTRKSRRQGNRNASNVYTLNVQKLRAAAFAHLPDSDTSNPDASKSDASKSDASESDPSKFEASEFSKKGGFDPSESGGDPSVNTTTDPSDKKPLCPVAAQPDEPELSPLEKFLDSHPDAYTWNLSKRQWGTEADLVCAQWIWKLIRKMYQDAAEQDPSVSIPADPDWHLWANDVRLMRAIDGRTHKQICELYKRVNQDAFWKKNIKSPSKLREQWDEVSLKLSPAVSRPAAREDQAFKATHRQVDYSLPENAGFRS
ncbi:helix-turn-helix domain-containing protein [Phytobacter diazotrophicus]|uniref:helix-turn-helix domain-containing protein n=1 Tax=Phytobacter diazotrophicus TaxID=395631 RepID=UPI002FF78EC1